MRKGKGGVSLDHLVGPERKGEGQRDGGARAGASRQAETPLESKERHSGSA